MERLFHVFSLEWIRACANDHARFERSVGVVRNFYALNTFWFIYVLTGLIDHKFNAIQNVVVWPLFWTISIPKEQVVLIIFLLFLLSVFISTFFTDRRWGRILIFVAILEYVAMEYSFGEKGITVEWWYPWLYTSFLFIFLPDFNSPIKISKDRRSVFLLILWGAQTLFLLLYTMVGLHKLIYLASLIITGQINILSPEIFSATPAYFIAKFHYPDNAILSFFLNHSLVMWVSQLGIIVVQAFALTAAFKPKLQKIWAFMLIMFHISTGIVFNIVFLQMVLLLIVLFYDSPFTKLILTGNNIKKIPLSNVKESE